MSLKPPSDIEVVKKEDKEAKLSRFIVERLQAADREAPAEICVFARSIESPVVSALTLQTDRLAKSDIRIRLVLTGLELEELQAAGAVSALLATKSEVRIAADSRLLEAHEQLTIGSDLSWIGDCVRREPMKRDAYERFAPACAETARATRIAFENLWSRALPFALPGLTPEDPDLGVSSIALSGNAAEGDLGGASGATRH